MSVREKPKSPVSPKAEMLKSEYKAMYEKALEEFQTRKQERIKRALSGGEQRAALDGFEGVNKNKSKNEQRLPQMAFKTGALQALKYKKIYGGDKKQQPSQFPQWR